MSSVKKLRRTLKTRLVPVHYCEYPINLIKQEVYNLCLLLNY